MVWNITRVNKTVKFILGILLLDKLNLHPKTKYMYSIVQLHLPYPWVYLVAAFIPIDMNGISEYK